MAGRLFEFGPYRLDVSERLLLRGSDILPLTPKAFDTLVLLVARSGRLVTKDELLQELWPDAHVEENNLAQNISLLRRTFKGDGNGSSYIETVPKVGYRFVREVRVVSDMPFASDMPVASGVAVVSGVPVVADVRDVEARSGPAPEPGLSPLPRHRDTRWLWGLGVAAAVLAAVPLFWRSRAAPAASGAASLVRLTSTSGLTMTPALSADGTLLAYASDGGSEKNLEIWVQRVGSAEAMRITQGAADDYAPSFSPDGREIVFRSERDGGGVYRVAAQGGEVTRVAPLGRRPRFSPDGKWIAYWIGTDAFGVNQANFPVPGTASIYIAPSTGGQPRQLRSDFAAASYPVWAPDSRHILFLGNEDPKVLVEPSDNLQPGSASVDWWVTPIDGGSAIATGANAAFRSLGLPSVSQLPETWTDEAAGVVMSATLDATQNLWVVPISSDNWRVSGAPRRLTFGTTMDAQPSVAGGHQMAFASLTGNLDIWSLPLDANRAEPSGPPQRVTADAFEHWYPAISEDGGKLAYSSRRSGTRDIWVKDLETGRETVVSTPPWSAFAPVFSVDGGRLAYRVQEKKDAVLEIVSLNSGAHERLSECTTSGGWSSDGKSVLCLGTGSARISVFNLQSKHLAGLLNHPEWSLWNPRFSPDDRWVLFNATTPGRSRIFVAPFRQAGPIPESEWIAITDSVWDDKPRWSPDGNAIYFISERDGFRCVWAQRLDGSKHPVGQAIAVFHAHEARRSMLNVPMGALEISVARDRLVFNMQERTGNIWMIH
jgi:Tol biopolymer transport system component/DNA-binding winged helix-turn-helix (wHTH) protein